MPYIAPTVTGESTVRNGRTYAVEDYHAIEPGLGIVVRTGNGDDGLGVTMWWAEPLATTLSLNLGLQIEGMKVSGEAELLGMDGNGTPLDSSGTLLNSTQYVIIPDLFDGTLARLPDQVFAVTTGAPTPDQVFTVLKLAEPPDQTFAVTRGPTPPDQVFAVQAITNRQVFTAEPPFMVRVFAEPADQVFGVIVGPEAPDRVFSVTRGPSAADQVFGVSVIDLLEVTTSWAPPDRTYIVTTGPNPPPVPDQVFGVSVGGPDAPPIPTPTGGIFNVRVGPAIPSRTFTVLAVERSYQVEVRPDPFVVTVGPDLPDQVFAVTAMAEPADQVFAVTVGADLPDQVFATTVVETFEVQAYDPPVQYAVSANGSSSYLLTGNGLAAASNPDLSFTVGQLVTFGVNTPGHPFWICDTRTTGGCAAQPAWALLMANNGTQGGNLRVRFAQPGTYFYNCGVHASMGGTITVT